MQRSENDPSRSLFSSLIAKHILEQTGSLFLLVFSEEGKIFEMFGGFPV